MSELMTGCQNLRHSTHTILLLKDFDEISYLHKSEGFISQVGQAVLNIMKKGFSIVEG